MLLEQHRMQQAQTLRQVKIFSEQQFDLLHILKLLLKYSISEPISTCLLLEALKLPKVTGLRVLLHRSVSLFTCL